MPPATPSDPALVALARSKINHIVFVIKENRTFDNYFGTFPGANGATTGQTCDGGDRAAQAGARPRVRRRAQLHRRHHRDQRRQDELLHRRRLRAVPPGPDPELLGLRAALHAGRRVLQLDLRADRGRAPVDVRGTVRPVRRPRTTRAAGRRQAPVLRRSARDGVLVPTASRAPSRRRSTNWRTRERTGPRRSRRTGRRAGRAPTSRCCPTGSRPPASRGRSTAGENEWVQPLRMVRHVRFSSMWNNVVSQRRVHPRPERRASSRRSRGSRRRSRCRITRRSASARVRTGPCDLMNAIMAEPVLEVDRRRADVGRLRRVLRPRAAAARRHVRARPARAGDHHLAVFAARATSTTRRMSSPRCCGSSRRSSTCRR